MICFYNSGIPDWLGRYFTLELVPSSIMLERLGSFCVGGGMACPGELIYPHLSVFPIVFSSAMCFAQAAHDEAVSRASLDSPQQIFHLHRPAPHHTVDWPTVLPYADNCNVVGSSATKVQEAKDSVVSSLRSGSLLVHEELEVTSLADALAVRLDGLDLLVRPTPKRL